SGSGLERKVQKDSNICFLKELCRSISKPETDPEQNIEMARREETVTPNTSAATTLDHELEKEESRP
ncbi:hypothetical protein TNCV_1081601, partial [Trichonephila clavipes]